MSHSRKQVLDLLNTPPSTSLAINAAIPKWDPRTVRWEGHLGQDYGVLGRVVVLIPFSVGTLENRLGLHR